MSILQAVNSYFALCYIAFIKASEINLFPSLLETEFCHDLSAFDAKDAAQIRAEHGGTNPFCMGELSSMLIGMAIVSQFVGKAVEVLVPCLKGFLRRRATARAARAARRGGLAQPEPRPPSACAAQALLDPYDAQDDIFKEYSRVHIQIGWEALSPSRVGSG